MLPAHIMHRPLLVSAILDYAAQTYPGSGVVSMSAGGERHYASYPDLARRIARLAHGLRAMGIGPGDRVATLAWNGYRHFELYYAIAGIGAVCHTLNPRLSVEQFHFIVNHAQDSVLFFDTDLAPLVASLRSGFPDGMGYVALCDEGDLPDIGVADLGCYETLLRGQPDTIDWPEMPEDTACALCYTSGTTGDPKGVLYSHRGMVLHSMFLSVTSQKSFRQGQAILPVVPLFHANAWGLPYAAPLVGAPLAFPGPRLDGASLFNLADNEQVYSAYGVPTVWLGLLEEMDRRGRAPKGLAEVQIGGAAAPRRMIERFLLDYGVDVVHGWGMTEMSPVGTLSRLTPEMETRSLDERIALKSKQGRAMYGIDMKVVDDAGKTLPRDGQSAGDLLVRGNGVISGYYRNEAASAAAITDDGWFRTGDIANIDAEGFLSISDRAKDLIKSGGEWISSLDVENIAMGHPGIANCGVIGVPDPKWDERPLLVAIASGTPPSVEDVRAHLAKYLAKWQVPDDVVFVDELPMTATGKVSKKTLRERFVDHPMPGQR